MFNFSTFQPFNPSTKRFTFSSLHLFTLLLGALLVVQTSCTKQPFFERNTAIDNREWNYGDTVTFSFEVEDTLSVHHLFVNFRHTDGYPFSNIWLSIEEVTPAGESSKEKKNFKLALADGVWTGNCTGEICFNRVFYKAHVFAKPGIYTYQLLQDTRTEGLPNILDLGMRVERVLEPLN